MAFDGILLRAAAREAAALLGARVERVFQPEPLLITLCCYRRGEEGTLLVSCHPRFARLHLTARAPANPPAPPDFCMLLRKHLEGGVVTCVEQAGLERVLRIGVVRRNAEGEAVRAVLIAELTGKHANLVLVNGDGVILDALRRVPASLSRHREVLPGRAYVAPPAQDKLPLSEFLRDPERASAALAARWAAPAPADPTEAGRTAAPAWRRLVAAIDGPGPVLARELCLRAGLDPDGDAGPATFAPLCAALAGLAADVEGGRFRPTRAGGAFAALPLPALAAARGVPEEVFPSPGALLDAVFAPLEAAERLQRERQRLGQAVAAHLARARTRLGAQEEELREVLDAEAYRVQGELIMAHLHLARPGLASLRVTDYYDPDAPRRDIPLDPRLGPAANAQVYFKKYARAKRARAVVEEKVRRTREEIAYLESVEAALEMASTAAELADVAGELAETGYLREAKAQRGAPNSHGAPARRGSRTGPAGGGAAPAGEPLSYLSSDGIRILVGKNNRQNDHLTLRVAAPGDLWLHARRIPGAHVIVRLGAGPAPAAGREGGGGADAPPAGLDALPRRTLEEAALLAAYHSKARRSSNVPVDYAFRRHVRKPRGARPGMVVYTDHRTLFVTPSEESVAALTPPRRDG